MNIVGQEHTSAGPLDIADHVVDAMRESGMLSQWKIEDQQRSVVSNRSARRELRGGSTMVVDDFGVTHIHLSVEQPGFVRDLPFDAVVRATPAYLLGVLREAVADLEQIVAREAR